MQHPGAMAASVEDSVGMWTLDVAPDSGMPLITGSKHGSTEPNLSLFHKAHSPSHLTKWAHMVQAPDLL